MKEIFTNIRAFVMRHFSFLLPRNWKAKGTPRNLPKQLLTLPLGQSNTPLAGIVTKVVAPTAEIWQLIARADSSLETIAKLLSILILDDIEPIMPAQLMPSRPGTALLRTDGQMRRGRGFFLAPWALREIDRLTQWLIKNHSSYLAAVSSALRQQPTKDFGSIPADFIFPEPLASQRLGQPPPKVVVDVSESERIRHKLKWYQVVSQDYARNRYLVLLTREQLAARTAAIVGNMHVIDESGLVSPGIADPSLYYWMTRLAEIQTEMVLRHGPYPAGWHGMIDFSTMPASLGHAGPDAAFRLATTGDLSSSFLVKYGKRAHLEESLRAGRFRIAPASSYGDPSLNTAIQDDELSWEIAYDPSVPFNDIPPGTMLLPPGRVPVRQQVGSDYYVFCLAAQLSKRLFLDFEAEACLVIHEPDAFIERLLEAVLDKVGNWKALSGEVEYYDPLLVNPAEIRPPVWKNFRFAYQKELRLAWIPLKVMNNLDALFMEISSINDIAEIVKPQF